MENEKTSTFSDNCYKHIDIKMLFVDIRNLQTIRGGDIMKKVVFIISSIIVLLLLVLLTKDKLVFLQHSNVEKIKKIDQLVLFEYSYTNYSDGFQTKGFFIDNEGNVKEYNLIGKGYSSEGVWNQGTSKQDVEENYRKATKVIKKIDSNTLYKKYETVKLTKDGDYSNKKSMGADQGSYDYYCYLWDENTNQYRKILLSKAGDWSYYNLDSKAKQLDKWLKSLY